MAQSAEPLDVSSDDDLSDAQIQELLKQAEARLRAEAKAAESAQTTAAKASNFPKLNAGSLPEPYIKKDNGVATIDASRTVKHEHRLQASKPRKVEDPVAVKQKKIEEKKATAGPLWHNLPRTDVTPELKRDLQLLRMRNVLDPHRHYKKEDKKTPLIPEFSQVGTVIEGPTEFFNARINKKDRKRTLVEEVLAQEKESKRFKRKAGEIQEKKASGKKAFYKALKERRKK